MDSLSKIGLTHARALVSAEVVAMVTGAEVGAQGIEADLGAGWGCTWIRP